MGSSRSRLIRDANNHEKLAWLCRNGSVQEVEDHIKSLGSRLKINACSDGKVDHICCFLKHGADPLLLTRNNVSCLDIAIQNQRFEAVLTMLTSPLTRDKVNQDLPKLFTNIFKKLPLPFINEKHLLSIREMNMEQSTTLFVDPSHPRPSSTSKFGTATLSGLNRIIDDNARSHQTIMAAVLLEKGMSIDDPKLSDLLSKIPSSVQVNYDLIASYLQLRSRVERDLVPLMDQVIENCDSRITGNGYFLLAKDKIQMENDTLSRIFNLFLADRTRGQANPLEKGNILSPETAKGPLLYLHPDRFLIQSFTRALKYFACRMERAVSEFKALQGKGIAVGQHFCPMNIPWEALFGQVHHLICNSSIILQGDFDDLFQTIQSLMAVTRDCPQVTFKTNAIVIFAVAKRIKHWKLTLPSSTSSTALGGATSSNITGATTAATSAVDGYIQYLASLKDVVITFNAPFEDYHIGSACIDQVRETGAASVQSIVENTYSLHRFLLPFLALALAKDDISNHKSEGNRCAGIVDKDTVSGCIASYILPLSVTRSPPL